MKNGVRDKPDELDEEPDDEPLGVGEEVASGKMWRFNNVLGSALHNTVHFSVDIGTVLNDGLEEESARRERSEVGAVLTATMR